MSVCFFTPLVTLLSVLPIAYGHFTSDVQSVEEFSVEERKSFSNAALHVRLISAEIDKRVPASAPSRQDTVVNYWLNKQVAFDWTYGEIQFTYITLFFIISL